MTREQLLHLGFTAKAIRCRIADGRLHPAWRGIYAVGRRDLSEHGWWMAAVLACGPGAALSHASAGALWRIRGYRGSTIHVSLTSTRPRKRPRISVHRRPGLAAHMTRHRGIPVTSPALTIVDLAASLPPYELESAINEADKRDLTDPTTLRRALDELPPISGIGKLRALLDRRTFLLTDSELERRFLPLAEAAGLPPPLTQHYVDGFRVDFYWPDLGLVVETDGLRYHRTPAQQSRDRLRDHAHAAAGLTPLRFTHGQIAFEPAHVTTTLAAVARRLGG